MGLSPLRWSGGKSKLLSKIRFWLEPYNAPGYADVFLGGGSTILDVASRHPSLPLWANDLDPLVYSFWQVVGVEPDDVFEDFIRSLPVPPLPPPLGFYEPFVEPVHPPDLVGRARKLFLANRLSFGGKIGAGPGGGWDSSWVETSPDKPPENGWGSRYNYIKLVKQLQDCRRLLHGRLTLRNQDCLEFVNEVPDDYFVYLDPPYVKWGKRMYKTAMNYEQHRALREVLTSRKRWACSYDLAPLVEELFGSSSLCPVTVFYPFGKSRKTECIIVGGLVNVVPLGECPFTLGFKDVPLPEGWTVSLVR